MVLGFLAFVVFIVHNVRLFDEPPPPASDRLCVQPKLLIDERVATRAIPTLPGNLNAPERVTVTAGLDLYVTLFATPGPVIGSPGGTTLYIMKQGQIPPFSPNTSLPGQGLAKVVRSSRLGVLSSRRFRLSPGSYDVFATARSIIAIQT